MASPTRLRPRRGRRGLRPLRPDLRSPARSGRARRRAKRQRLRAAHSRPVSGAGRGDRRAAARARHRARRSSPRRAAPAAALLRRLRARRRPRPRDAERLRGDPGRRARDRRFPKSICPRASCARRLSTSAHRLLIVHSSSSRPSKAVGRRRAPGLLVLHRRSRRAQQAGFPDAAHLDRHAPRPGAQRAGNAGAHGAGGGSRGVGADGGSNPRTAFMGMITADAGRFRWTQRSWPRSKPSSS